MRRKVKSLFPDDWPDVALESAYWLFWTAVFTLAIEQATYLFSGHGNLISSIWIGIMASVLKGYVQNNLKSETERETKTVDSLIRTLALRAGPDASMIRNWTDPSLDPAFSVIVDETGGLESYQRGSSPIADEKNFQRALPPAVFEQLPRWQELKNIDRKLVSVAQRIGNIDRENLMGRIRIILLSEIFVRKRRGDTKTDMETLDALANEAPRFSPIYRLIDALRKECAGQTSLGIQIGTWGIVSAWMKVSAPKTFDDLCGEDGPGLPPMPQILKDALKPQPPQPPGKTFYS